MSAPHAPPGGPLRVTVAVCTRDRAQVLARALDSIGDQTRPPDEVLVVDNAPSDDATRTLLERRYPDVRYVREPVAGLDFARNRALAASDGDVVAFIDDDAVADRGWVAALEGAFRAGERVGACSGRIEALSLETEGQRLFEANGGLFAGGSSTRRLPTDPRRSLWGRLVPTIAWAAGAGSGCNLSVRRDLAMSMGGFDEALDLGSALPGGGDNDMLWRVMEAGAEVVYEPAAIVRHEHRRELGGVEDQILGHQRALVALTTKAVSGTGGLRRIPVLLFLGWRLVKPGVRLVRRAFGRDPLPAGLLLRVWKHCFLGLGAYREGRRLAAARRSAATLV
jgi:glycosyltransferase involved in cell wall biosynthesis